MELWEKLSVTSRILGQDFAVWIPKLAELLLLCSLRVQSGHHGNDHSNNKASQSG